MRIDFDWLLNIQYRVWRRWWQSLVKHGAYREEGLSFAPCSILCAHSSSQSSPAFLRTKTCTPEGTYKFHPFYHSLHYIWLNVFFFFSLIGGLAVIIGLYTVLWGKAKDHEEIKNTTNGENVSAIVDLEHPLLSENWGDYGNSIQ